jgi:hypothetical protein
MTGGDSCVGGVPNKRLPLVSTSAVAVNIPVGSRLPPVSTSGGRHSCWLVSSYG